MAILPTNDTLPVVPPGVAPGVIGTGERTNDLTEGEVTAVCVPFVQAGTVRVRYARGEDLTPLPYPVEDE